MGEKLNGESGAVEVLLGTPENARKTVEMLDRANQLLARMDSVVRRADQQVFDADGVMPKCVRRYRLSINCCKRHEPA